MDPIVRSPDVQNDLSAAIIGDVIDVSEFSFLALWLFIPFLWSWCSRAVILDLLNDLIMNVANQGEGVV